MSGEGAVDNRPLNKMTTGSYYLIFDQLINYGMGALFWILLAKILSTGLIGQTLVVIALTTVVLGFTGLGAEVTISKYIAEHNARNNPRASKKAFTFGLKTGLGVSAGAALFLAVFSGQIATLFYHDGSLTVLILVAVLAYLPSQTILTCFFGAFQGSHKMRNVAITDLIFQVTRISLAIALVLINVGPISLVLSFAIGSMIALAASYFLFLRRLFVNSANITEAVKLDGIAKFSAFNYLATGVTTFSTQLGYIMLGQQNFSNVALFGISYMISGIVSAVVLSFGKAGLPTTSAELLQKNRTDINAAISTALKVAITLSGFIYILLIVAPSLILSSLSHEYVAASGALQILVLTAIILSLSGFIGYILNGMNKPGLVARISVISSLCVIGFSVFLIPRLGIEGAALSGLAGASVSLGLYVWQSTRQDVKISFSGIYRPIASVSLAIIVGLAIFQLGMVSVLAALAISLIIYVSLIAGLRVTNRSELNQMVQIAVQAAGFGRKR